MRKHPLVQMLVIGAIAVAIGIPIALIIPWFPSEGAIQAGNVRTLYDVLLIASVPIFVLVETVVLFSVWKFRMRPGEEEKDGPPIHGHTRLEVLWTALPAVLIVSLCTYAYTVLRSNEASKRGAMTVNVTERQFAFEFSYPQANGKTVVSPVLYMAKGQPVVFRIRSLDVIHSFFVPNFSEKIDAVPGITTTLRVTPTRLGTYPAECTELCGAGHSLMRSEVRVVTPSAFQTWLAAQPANAAPPIGVPPPAAAQPGVPGAAAPAAGAASTGAGSSASGSSSAAGKTLFAGSAGCSSCHTLAAAGATGTVGPNLDVRLRSDCQSAASKRIRGSSLNQCIFTAITKPYAYLPPGYRAGIMPPNFAQTLTSTQIQSLVSFLTGVAK
ncbi:MAG: cytochrome c oxidase subunit II [Solirubrobacterales bacterium]|nr:cytochrome c oxidase subunit II [Solirubrobacterales bacterium]